MAKKEGSKEEQSYKKQESKPEAPAGLPPEMANLPKEVQEKLKVIKEKIDKFQKQIIEKFDKYIMGVALMPPPRPEQLPPPEPGKPAPTQQELEKKIYTLVLVDDTDSTKMSKAELRDKLTTIIEQTAKSVDPDLVVQTVILSELWQSCYDGKSDLLQMIALSAPVYDTGMLSAVKIAEIHKSMVLKKFEKYIVAYVLAGSLVQGKATKESDIDVFVVIDDTDVKKMTRAELKDKLRAIIIGMGIEAGEMTGIRNKLNIQVYILTDFWESVKEANPVIFTFLRDGVPFFDRGIFMPWKQLLKMGRIKPSAEAIDMYMSSGEQVLDRVKFKLREIGTEDFFWAILTPSQAALMMYGIPPPTPKETPDLMREVFVKKEKLLEDKDVDTLAAVIKMRKDIEHGERKEVIGKEIDGFLDDCDKFLKRIRRLFTQIETLKEKESMMSVYDTIVSVARDILLAEGIEKVTDTELLHSFEEELIASGKVPPKYLRSLHAVMKGKADYDSNKLTKTEVDKVRKEANELIRFLIEYLQRKRAKELERARVKVKYGQRFAEVLLLGDKAFVTHDIDAEPRKLSKAKIAADGSLGVLEDAAPEELEHALASAKIPHRMFIKPGLMKTLQELFGKDAEIFLG